MEIPASNIPVEQLRKLAPVEYRYRRNVTYSYASFIDSVQPRGLKPKKGRKGVGISFEGKVVECLTEREDDFLSAPIFRYHVDCYNHRFCIPDGILILDSEIIVVEVKLVHTLTAYFQLTNLYFPVVSKAFNLPVRGIEVVKAFDGEVRYPQAVSVFSKLDDFLSSEKKLGVLLWGR